MKKNSLIIYIFSFTLIIATLLTVIDFACFDSDFYKKEYIKCSTKFVIGTSDEELEKMTDVLLGYLRDDYKTLDLKATINGEVKEVFNKREKDHMVDVKNLYQNAILVRNILAGITLVLLLIIIYQRNFLEIQKIYLKTLLFAGLILGFLGIYISADFDTFWTNFHHIFFSGNDLWLLDPSTDILIMMVPGTFFNDLVWRIIIIFVVLIICYYFIFKLLKTIAERKMLVNKND